MLPGSIPPSQPVIYRPDLMSQLAQLGLSGNLEFALDAGEAGSNASNRWKDLSANIQDFYQGSSASTLDSATPGFNGTAGNRSKNEYWSFDGGDNFQCVAGLPAFADNFHKDSAAWTFATWYWPVTSTAQQSLISTAAVATSSLERGIDFVQDVTSANNVPKLWVGNNSARTSFASTLSPVMGAWNFVALSVDEANGNYRFQVNESGETRALGGYTSPSASSAEGFLYLCDSDGGGTNLASGSRMAIAMCWSTPLSSAQLAALRTAMLPRFN